MVFSDSVVKDDGDAFAIPVALLLCRERIRIIVGLDASLHLEWESTSDTSANLTESLT